MRPPGRRGRTRAPDGRHTVARGIIPGIAFGQYGEGFVRLSYAASMDVIEQAMARLTDYVTKKRG